MIAIKYMEMPKGCWYSTKLKLSGIKTCPLKEYCSEKHIKEAPLDTRPNDCPLADIVTCKDCKKRNECFSDMGDDWYCPNGERRE